MVERGGCVGGGDSSGGGSEGADGAGLVDDRAGFGGGWSDRTGVEGAYCLSKGGIGWRIGAAAVEGRLEDIGILGGDAHGMGVGTVGGGGGGAEGSPLIGGVLAA